MTTEDSNMAANAICHSVTMVQEAWQQAAYEQMRPAVIFKPRLFPDGDQWCALLGESLQVGVVGFGDSPAEAMYDFDKQWNAKLKGAK